MEFYVVDKKYVVCNCDNTKSNQIKSEKCGMQFNEFAFSPLLISKIKN